MYSSKAQKYARLLSGELIRNLILREKGKGRKKEGGKERKEAASASPVRPRPSFRPPSVTRKWTCNVGLASGGGHVVQAEEVLCSTPA